MFIGSDAVFFHSGAVSMPLAAVLLSCKDFFTRNFNWGVIREHVGSESFTPTELMTESPKTLCRQSEVKVKVFKFL